MTSTFLFAGAQTQIPMWGGTHDLKVAPTLQLTDVSATVTGFRYNAQQPDPVEPDPVEPSGTGQASSLAREGRT